MELRGEQADRKISGFNCLRDTVMSGSFASPSGDYLRYSKLRGSVISVEGIVSAGKTTLGKSLADYLNSLGIRAKFFQEFVDESLLGAFYKDPPKYAFAFQLFMLRSCIANLELAEAEARESGAVCIIDRCLWGNAVFAAMQREKGNLSEEEWSIYLRILKTKAPCTADCVVFLDCNPARSFERIKIRGWRSESSVPLEYLQELERYYTTAMILHLQHGTANIVPVQWDNFGTVRQVLDSVLQGTLSPLKPGKKAAENILDVFTKDRLFRARCVAALSESCDSGGHAACGSSQKTGGAGLAANAGPQLSGALLAESQ